MSKITDNISKLRTIANVKDYGARGDGVTNDTAAIQAMITALGYARLSAGNYLLSTTTFSGPLHFEPGAYFTAPSGVTVTISNTVTSPKQHIFQGSGTYSLAHNSTTGVGEQARMAHVSWFGAFPSSVESGSVSNQIARALTAMGTTREGVLEFDVGNYNIGSGLTVPRGVHIKGSGTRRTVFRVLTDGYNVFSSGDVAVKFSDIQFELAGSLTAKSTGAYIRVAHGECEVYNVNVYNSRYSIVVNANNCRVHNIVGAYGATPSSGSSTVLIQGGSGNVVSGIQLGTSSFGPDTIVHVGGVGASTISNVSIDNVGYIAPCTAVLVEASAADVRRVNINNVRYNGSSGTAPASIIRTRASGTYGIDDVIIDDVIVNSYATAGIVVDQAGTGTTQGISIDNVIISGATGTGISFTRTAGTLKDVTIGANVDVAERATPYEYVGTMTGFKISPQSVPNVQPAYCYDFTIADDSFAQIDLRRNVFTGMLMVTSGTSATAEYGIFYIRAATTPNVVPINASANMTSGTSVLAGTTGVDGKFTVGVTSGVLYFENRLGASQRVSVSLLTGVP